MPRGQGSGVGRGGGPGTSTPFPGRTLWFGVSLDTWAGPTTRVRGLSSGLALPPMGHVTGQVPSPLTFCGSECKVEHKRIPTAPRPVPKWPPASQYCASPLCPVICCLSVLFWKLDPVLPAPPSCNPSVACHPPALAESDRAGPHTLPVSPPHTTTNIPKWTGAPPPRACSNKCFSWWPRAHTAPRAGSGICGGGGPQGGRGGQEAPLESERCFPEVGCGRLCQSWWERQGRV